MAEALAIAGIAATVVQLVSFSGTVLTTGYGFLSKISKAPSELRELLAESAGLNCVLGQLQQLIESATTTDETFQSLQRLGVFNDCQQSLLVVKRSLDACEQACGKDARNFGRRLIWPFKERETKEAIQRLNRLRALVSSAIDANSALALRRIEEGQTSLRGDVQSISGDLRSYISQEDFAKILSWLCPATSFSAQESLNAALRSQYPGTSKWFLNSPIYHHWLNGGNQLLWITGLPGAGKTVLCSAIINHLQSTSNSPSSAIVFFFCDHRFQDRMTLKGFLMNLARQLAKSSESCAAHVRRVYHEKTKDPDRVLNVPEYILLVRACITEFKEIFIVVDALDEASEKDAIVETLVEMLQIPAVHVLLTSREDMGTRRVLQSSSSAPLCLSLHQVMQRDIDFYVEMEINSRITSGKLKLRNQSLVPQIQDKIIGRAGTFLQAKLQLDMVSSLTNDKAIRIALQNMPNGLEATYENILASTLRRYPTRAHEIKVVLQWLVVSAQPLSALQLAEVVAISPEDQSLDFDAISTDPEDVIEPISQIVRMGRVFKDKTIVGFSHFSIEEYLQSREIANGPAKELYINHEEAHAKAAELCLQYLTFSDFDFIPTKDNGNVLDMPRKHSLLKYAATFWPMHLRESKLSQTKFQDRLLPKLGWFLNPSTKPNLFLNWELLLDGGYPQDEAGCRPPLLFAISEGLYHLVDILLLQLENINYKFPRNLTCLMLAVSKNEVSIAKQLLEKGADANQPGHRYLSPLHIAAANASEDMVKLLLAAGASIHARSDSESTPFYRAARGGSVEILRLLYELGSEIDVKTYDGWTPLMEAVERGHEGAVKLLLEWGADPRNENDDGMNCLDMAFALSHSGIDSLLKEALEKRGLSVLVPRDDLDQIFSWL